jgi:hypothetical protein
MVDLVFIIDRIIKYLMMSNSIRSDSYFESVRRGLHPLTTTPIVPQKRSATTENVNRKAVNHPGILESYPSTRSATMSESRAFSH